METETNLSPALLNFGSGPAAALSLSSTQSFPSDGSIKSAAKSNDCKGSSGFLAQVTGGMDGNPDEIQLNARPVYAVLQDGAFLIYTNQNKNSIIKKVDLDYVGSILQPANL